MTFDAGTWWLAVLLLGFVTAGLVYLLKRSLFGRIDKLDESMKEISENSVKKSDYESTVQSLQADIKQIREEFDGYNFKELAGRYGLTEVRIRSIVSDKMREVRTRPMDGQQSLF